MADQPAGRPAKITRGFSTHHQFPCRGCGRSITVPRILAGVIRCHGCGTGNRVSSNPR